MPNQDTLDRKAAWVERMFDRLFSAIKENTTATILVLSIGLNFWLMKMVTDLQQARFDDKTVSSQQMIDEVRRSVQRELPKQLAPIQAKQDSTGKAVDTSLINLNQTVESVKQYFNKNKKR